MLSYLTLKNFKCFKEQSFALGNLTIIAGANGAGKSTLIQALMLLRQSDLDKRTLLSEKVQLRGSLVYLKSADAIRYFESEDTDITISIEDDTIDDALDVTIIDDVNAGIGYVFVDEMIILLATSVLLWEMSRHIRL